LAIIHNPNSQNPQTLYKDLLNELPKEYQKEETVDKPQMDSLKSKLSGSMGIKVQ
jgi:hypothetical protein